MLVIRLAALEDVLAMHDVMVRATVSSFPRYYSDEQSDSAARYLTVPDPDLIADGTSYVVFEGDNLVGCGAWSRRLKLFTGSSDQEDLSAAYLDPSVDAARIRAFFVSPSHGRRGIGRMVYDRCETDARLAGFTRFELMATLPGVPLYSALGFR